MNNICIIGNGMVGNATGELFGIRKRFDRDPEKSTITLEDAAKCEIIFICLPTPVNPDGSFQVESIQRIIKTLEELGSKAIYVIRSTVGPRFALDLQRKLNIDRIISNPEFLSEATAIEDTKNPPFIIIGGCLEARKRIKALYESRIKGAPVIETDNTTAEMIKLSMNAYFATKVIFANQVYDAARRVGANYEVVRKALEAHPYGPKNHFRVWFREKRGVHGSCLPKDMEAFVFYTNSELVKEVSRLNKKYKFLKKDNDNT